MQSKRRCGGDARANRGDVGKVAGPVYKARGIYRSPLEEIRGALPPTPSLGLKGPFGYDISYRKGG